MDYLSILKLKLRIGYTSFSFFLDKKRNKKIKASNKKADCDRII